MVCSAALVLVSLNWLPWSRRMLAGPVACCSGPPILRFRGLRHVGRNWVTQCPSCAGAGRDRGKDNLAISVEEPLKYLCWAGCTNIQIRAALGAPAPVNAR